MPRLATALLFVLVFGAASAAQELPPIAPVAPLPPPFPEWLASFREEAATRGIRPEILDRALSGIEPVAQILDRDHSQAEFTLNLAEYLRRRLTTATIRTAQEMYSRHRALLGRIGEKYGVNPRVLVAVWGLESNFGRFAGVRPTIPTLATLAYDPRRAAFFRSELFSALEILNRGDADISDLKGSWAGALGQPQFMPSSYLEYAQDFDGDGRRDIWTSEPDVFASIAYYMQRHGWTKGEAWGREIKIPAAIKAKALAIPRRDTGCRAERLMTAPQPLKDWARFGLRSIAAGRCPPPQLPPRSCRPERETSSSMPITTACWRTTARTPTRSVSASCPSAYTDHSSSQVT